jgi:2,5-dioxopentanoate dehydrogenase
MSIHGTHILGNSLRTKSGDHIFHGYDATQHTPLEGEFTNASVSIINTALDLAMQAFLELKKMSSMDRVAFLERIGEELMQDEALIERCRLETGLGVPRLLSERDRTVNQLKLFASLLKEGSWVEAKIDTALPDRKPLPRPDIRQMLMPIGPVAVFGASNFPLAFSVAGGDTASAFAAGCPVIFKAHPLHPGTSERVGEAIIRAAIHTGMPDGIFSMIHGDKHEPGLTLVKHPAVKAVAFTGSFKGGKALFNAAVARDIPIPVFAEMGSTNPVFLLPRAVEARGKQIAEGLVGSISLGVGQFCTKPGIFIGLASEKFDELVNEAGVCVKKLETGPMLSGLMKQNYLDGVNSLLHRDGVELLAKGLQRELKGYGVPYLLKTNLKTAMHDEAIAEEIFGPCSVACVAENKEQVLEYAASLKGHLTATVHGTEDDLEEYGELLALLTDKVGRIIINGYPTGVEVCHAMVHGGPFPATTDSRSTSVGTGAIKRFVRPVAFQNFPQRALPEVLRDENPTGIYRVINGQITKDRVEELVAS